MDLAKNLIALSGNIFTFHEGFMSQQFPFIFKTSKLPWFSFNSLPSCHWALALWVLPINNVRICFLLASASSGTLTFSSSSSEIWSRSGQKLSNRLIVITFVCSKWRWSREESSLKALINEVILPSGYNNDSCHF